MSEKEIAAGVATELLRHDALRACESRGDLELIARAPIPDMLWSKIEKWSLEKGCGAGEALWRKHSERERERLLEMVRPQLDAIFFDKDGNRRADADADQRLDWAVEMAEAENPEAMAMFNAAMEPWLTSVPDDASGKFLEDSLKSFSAGFESARLLKAHTALQRLWSTVANSTGQDTSKL